MAHYAEINTDNNKVKRVLVVDNEQEDRMGELGISLWLCANFGGDRWVKTSYNGTVRKNYAGIGYTFDEQRDAFIPPKPYPSWILNEDTCLWVAPVALPTEQFPGKLNVWVEETQSWVFEDLSY
jgi:hypothetical protein